MKINKDNILEKIVDFSLGALVILGMLVVSKIALLFLFNIGGCE